MPRLQVPYYPPCFPSSFFDFPAVFFAGPTKPLSPLPASFYDTPSPFFRKCSWKKYSQSLPLSVKNSQGPYRANKSHFGAPQTHWKPFWRLPNTLRIRTQLYKRLIGGEFNQPITVWWAFPQDAISLSLAVQRILRVYIFKPRRFTSQKGFGRVRRRFFPSTFFTLFLLICILLTLKERRLVSIKSASRRKEKRGDLKFFLLLWLQPVRPRHANQINLFFASNAQVALKVAVMKNGHLGQ